MAKQFLDIIQFKYKTSEAYKKRVIEILWTIHHWQLGRQLLEELTRRATSKLFTPRLMIEDFPGAHDYKEFQGRGYLPDDPRLYYDLNYCQRRPCEIDPTEEYVVQCNKTYVYLFHELVHYYHDLLGQFKARGGFDEEIRTVGLYEYTNEQFSENAFRRQVALDRRPCYLWVSRLNPSLYRQEKQKRATLGLPEQSTLTRRSPECNINFSSRSVLPKAS